MCSPRAWRRPGCRSRSSSTVWATTAAGRRGRTSPGCSTWCRGRSSRRSASPPCAPTSSGWRLRPRGTRHRFPWSKESSTTSSPAATPPRRSSSGRIATGSSDCSPPSSPVRSPPGSRTSRTRARRSPLPGGTTCSATSTTSCREAASMTRGRTPTASTRGSSPRRERPRRRRSARSPRSWTPAARMSPRPTALPGRSSRAPWAPAPGEGPPTAGSATTRTSEATARRRSSCSTGRRSNAAR